MTTLVLVRHAETIWHAENRYAGITDVPITPEGARQAEALGRWAATAGLAAIWSSPLTRCRQTAAPAAARTGLAPAIDAELRELDFGALEGLTKDEAFAAYPEAMPAYLNDPVNNVLPGAEPPAEAALRAEAALWKIAARHPQQRVLVVAHSTLIRLLLCRLFGLPLPDYRRRFPQLGNCALTELRLKNGEAGLLTYNTPAPSQLAPEAP